MSASGLLLTHEELRRLAAAADVLRDPFGWGDIDGWRAEVGRQLRPIVEADLAIVFLAQPPGAPQSPRSPVWSAELSDDDRGAFVRTALHDAGSDRARAFGTLAVTQREVVGNDWEGFYRDPAVTGFYLPRHIADTIALMLWDREGRKEASIELHRESFGSPLFGPEGAARLTLLLPAFRAGVAAIAAAEQVGRAVEALLGSLDLPLALADGRGRVVYQSDALRDLLASEPEGALVWSQVEVLAASQASLFEARGWSRLRGSVSHALEAAGGASAVLRTRTGGYLASVVQAPPALAGGRLGFLIRLEPAQSPVLSPTAIRDRFGLTMRELQVARLLASGARNDAVASALGISLHTARRHTERVMAKLGVVTRAEVGPRLWASSRRDG